MNWNMAPEYVSTVALCIIWVNARRGMPSSGLRDRLFQVCFAVTFCSMVTDILSTGFILAKSPELVPLGWGVTLTYFLVTPLMGLPYLAYSLSNLYDGRKTLRRVALWSVPGLCHAVAILIPSVQRRLFYFTPDGGYVQGSFATVGYALYCSYFAACLAAVFVRRQLVPSSLRTILLTFPLVVGLIRAVQFVFPNIVLSGSAATCALLLIYLFLQNKHITIDALTGVANRQEFMKTLEQLVRRPPGRSYAIIVLSLREFKAVNDAHGQHNGDALLAAVSDFLKVELGLREKQLYRYSGDEFAILLEEGKSLRAKTLVARIAARMAEPWETDGCICLLSGAMGVVRYPTNADNVAGLINGIEFSVSMAKRGGLPGNICYCDAALLAQAIRRRKITAILKENLENNGFEVYYQPIYDMESRRFRTAEALLRLNNSPLGAISPAEFIPIAESCGLIVPITYLVLERVCRYLRRLLDQGLELESVNVNCSAVQFTQPNLADKLSDIIRRSGVPFAKLKLEITESTLAENPSLVGEVVSALHAYGVRIGLDDFGTGYSNLTSVTSLPLDVIKLDKSLIWSAMENQRSSIVVQNLTRAFRQLGVSVLAEGVETEEQSRFVVECGCTLIQGFLYASPMSEAEFEVFLVRQQEEAKATR